jgi:hypothetical protein
MKKLLLILLILGILPIVAMSQAPPATVLGGAMFKNGGGTNFTAQMGGNINVIQKKDQYGHVTAQAYVQLGYNRV